jgi:hypothetical protein
VISPDAARLHHDERNPVHLGPLPRKLVQNASGHFYFLLSAFHFDSFECKNVAIRIFGSFQREPSKQLPRSIRPVGHETKLAE